MCCSSIYCRCNFFQSKPQLKMANALSHSWWARPEKLNNPLWQGFHPVKQTHLFGPCTCGIETPATYLTVEQIKAIAPAASATNIIKHIDHLNNTMHKYDITSPLRIAHFISQLLLESMLLSTTVELATGKAYEYRASLGNIYRGDGIKFKGRGLIQITGRKNYTAYGKYLHQNTTDGNNPQKLEQEPLASDSAGWYWKIFARCNPLADKDDVLAVSIAINGKNRATGLPNNFQERRDFLKSAKAVLQIK